MDDFLDEMKGALDARLYYAALVLALTIIDICASLEAENGRSSGSKYKSWVKLHLSEWEGPASADMLYQFRCGILHQGRAHLVSENVRLAFYVPNRHRIRIHGGTFREEGRPDVRVIDIQIFCDQVAAAARARQEALQQTPLFRRNAAQLIRRHPSVEVIPHITNHDLEVIA